ncbi:uncharacterized protein LOC135351008 isoform X2 [Halichondria panicea]|uniref:uncharacterized protein LOC135351008 isoform X2 n=1 Tax=Halichondria panicea TaxID=6063 RepID=UPI00312B4346
MAVVADHAVVEMEISLTVEERLDKQRWYIGEVTQEVAESLLSSNKQPHSFVVFTQPDTRQYILSARFPLEGLEDGVIEHLAILCEEGRWCITGQTDEYDDVIEAVNCYVLTFDPPLMPALQGKSFETQFSVTSAPPEYDKANRVLKPDIAPLPDITKVKVADEKTVEAQSGRISPTGRRGSDNNDSHSNIAARTRLEQANRSTWHRYSEHHRCHPKNVCSGCCYRPRTLDEWSGHSLEYDRHWWSPKGSGPLRVLGLLLLWLFCSPCIGCHIWHAEGTGYCLLWCCCSLWLDFDAFNDDDDDS